MYDNDEPSSSSHRRHASHSGALTSGKVKMVSPTCQTHAPKSTLLQIMAGLCGVLLVLLGKSWEGLGFLFRPLRLCRHPRPLPSVSFKSFVKRR
mmetsp:Transcript_11304/g.38625  ORF Transcript_11304/g.38625 Transcript_11304/m.38625 type:complete len:94 (-) Transcript_11304:74-355(-)